MDEGDDDDDDDVESEAQIALLCQLGTPREAVQKPAHLFAERLAADAYRVAIVG